MYNTPIGKILSRATLPIKGVFKTAVFWPLLLVGALLVSHCVSLGLVSRAAVSYTASEIMSVGKPLTAPSVLPVAMASGVPMVSTSSPLAASPASVSAVLVGEAAVLGGADPLSSLAPVGHGVRTYAARRGDTIASVAARFGVSEKTIAWANPGLADPIKPGAKITILPVSGILYAVQPGDTLPGIASAFGVDEGSIRKYNADLSAALESGSGTIVLPYASPAS